MALTNCKECNHQVSDKATSCPNCGAPLAKPLATPTSETTLNIPKSRSLAIALALFLGGLGIHKFYLNKPGWGVIYLVFCWTFIPMILGLIEAIIWLFTSDSVFQGRYST